MEHCCGPGGGELGEGWQQQHGAVERLGTARKGFEGNFPRIAGKGCVQRRYFARISKSCGFHTANPKVRQELKVNLAPAANHTDKTSHKVQGRDCLPTDGFAWAEEKFLHTDRLSLKDGTWK